MTTTAIATKPLRQVKTVKELLFNEQAKGQLAAVAARHLNPERMMRVVANAIRTTPKLQECEPMSFLGALMTCASLGLEPNTVLGHAYLVPFKNSRKGTVEAQVILGYKGFADLARRSGQVVSIHGDVVYSDDELWSYEYGSDMHLRHKPGPQEGEKLCAYCHVTLVDGQAFVVVPWSKVLKTRDASQGWKTAVRFGKTADSPWTTSEDRMGAKTAVRALANAGEMPLSVEFQDALQIDDRASNFAAFAMDPAAGAIEGEVTEVVDNEIGDVIEDQPEPDPNAGKGDEKEQEPELKKTKPRATKPKPSVPVRPKPKPELVPDAADKEELDNEPTVPDHVKSLVLRIVDDLRGADQEGEIGATLELFGEQIEILRETAPASYDEIQEAADRAREWAGAKAETAETNETQESAR